MLRLIGSTNPEVIEIQNRLTEMRKSILAHAYLSEINIETIQKIRNNKK